MEEKPNLQAGQYIIADLKTFTGHSQQLVCRFIGWEDETNLWNDSWFIIDQAEDTRTFYDDSGGTDLSAIQDITIISQGQYDLLKKLNTDRSR